MSDEEIDLAASPTTSSSTRCTTTSTTAWPPRSPRARTSCSTAAGRPTGCSTTRSSEGCGSSGIDFRDGILFVPEVLLAANAMKAGMSILRPLLAETGVERIGKVVIGTVKGDIHDIGKNLVAMMLEGAGFEVIDLGINTDVEQYLEALEEHQPEILGMSALLTTTMPYMKVVIDTLKEKGLRDDYIVLVGGAPLNEEFGARDRRRRLLPRRRRRGRDRQALVLARAAASRAAGPVAPDRSMPSRSAPRTPTCISPAARSRARCSRPCWPQRLDARRRQAACRRSSTTARADRARGRPDADRAGGPVRPRLRRLRRLRHRRRARSCSTARRRAACPAPTATSSSPATTRWTRCRRRSPAPSTSPTSSPGTSRRSSCGLGLDRHPELLADVLRQLQARRSTWRRPTTRPCAAAGAAAERARSRVRGPPHRARRARSRRSSRS